MNRWLCFLLFGWLAVSVFGEEPDWIQIGPAGGTIVQILPDRAHPGIWYLLENPNDYYYYYYSSYTNLYRSTDNGETWEHTRINGVGKLLVHSASSEVFIVRYGRDGKRDLLSSTDLGRSFQLRCGNSPQQIFDHPSDPKILWGSGISDNGYDLSVSYDRGAHWQSITNLPYRLGKMYEIDGYKYPAYWYYLSSVLVSPLDAKTVYVSTEVEFPVSCSGEYISLELVSTNSGRSWAFAKYPAGRYIYDPAFPDRAFSVNNEEIRILTRNGWRRLAPRLFDDVVGVPGRPGMLYALYDGKQWISRDGGTNWSRVNIGPGGKSRVLQARTFPEGSLLAGTYGAGGYVIDDTGQWHGTLGGFPQAGVLDVATAPGSRIVFIVTRDSFLYRSVNSGRTWKNITDNLPRPPTGYSHLDVIVNQTNARHIFAMANDQVAVSFDAGETWADVPQKRLSRVFFSPDFKTVYFSKPAYGHLYKSTDGGITLQELPAEFGSPKNTIRDLAVDRFNGYLYAATERGLFVSNDEAKTAEQIATDLSPDCLHCLSFDQIVALPLRGQYLAIAEGWLYRSVNQGVTWQKLSQGRGKLHVADDSGRHLFLVTGGLLESTDGGRTWDPISASIHPGLAQEAVTAMTDPRYRPLYVATTLGMFKTDTQ